MNLKSADPNHGIIRGSTVLRTSQPVLVDCANRTESSDQGALSVVPLMDGDVVAGLEIRCSCGSNAVVECIYPEAQPQDQEQPLQQQQSEPTP